jgi:D-alanyl-D-alanine carboxypeptidase/D-alanyl-D-alanine-endopeptidase (penicillin-binding protein 4)
LAYSGYIRRDTLYGDLYLLAGGDPGFGGARSGEDIDSLIREMTDAVKRAGIRFRKGNLYMYLPGDYYPAHGSWPIEDIGNYYGTGVWGFNYNDNMYKLYLQTGNTAGVPLKIVKTEPEIPLLKIVNRGLTAPRDGDDTSYLYGDPVTYERTLIGAVPQSDSLYVIKGGIPDPPRNFLLYFEQKLKEGGISSEGDFTELRTGALHVWPLKILYTHYSLPLKEMVKTTLNYSINHYSEALARLVIEGDNPGKDYIPKEKINAYFRARGFRLIDLEDGSGLAPDNLIAPSEFTRFLRRQIKKHGRDYVLDILPQAGVDGYAKYFMRNSPYQKQVWLKSGSVSKVLNYTGVFRGASGKYYVFAIMTNHNNRKTREVKKKIEKYIEALIEHL